MNYYQKKRLERLEAEEKARKREQVHDCIAGALASMVVAGLVYWWVVAFVESL